MTSGSEYLEIASAEQAVWLDPRVAVLQTPDAPYMEREAASDSIVEEFRPPVFRVANKVLHSVLDAEEVTQETFLRVFTKIDTYHPRPKSTFGSWVLKIAQHSAFDTYNRTKKRPTTVSFDGIYADDYLPDESQKGPEAQYIDETLASEEMSELLRQITPSFAAALALHVVEGLSYKTIAERLNVLPATVGTRIHRGKKELQQILEQN